MIFKSIENTKTMKYKNIETFKLKLNPEMFEEAFSRYMQEKASFGLTNEERENEFKYLIEEGITLRLYYEEGQGFFAVQPKKVISPYTGKRVFQDLSYLLEQKVFNED